MTDGSEPNDMPKSESYRDDRMKESKIDPEVEQKGENLNGNQNIEDETKNVEMNQSTSGVTKRPTSTIPTKKKTKEENDVNKMANEMANDKKLQNDKSNTVSRMSKDISDMSNVDSGATERGMTMSNDMELQGDNSNDVTSRMSKDGEIINDTMEENDISDMSNVNSGVMKSGIAMNSNRGDTSTSKPPCKKPNTDDTSDDTIEGNDVGDMSNDNSGAAVMNSNNANMNNAMSKVSSICLFNQIFYMLSYCVS